MMYRLKHGLSCTYVDNFYRYEKIEDIDRKSFDGQTPPVFQATVQAPDGCLWIAKFPSKHDETDSGAWEMVVHDLAELCGKRSTGESRKIFTKWNHISCKTF